MTRKKRGLWTFIFSLIPGAGEMYLGFMKQGVSLMSICLLWIMFCAWTRFELGLFIVPVIWFYSFFHVHNLNSLPDAEFYEQDDYYMLFHLDEIVRIDKWERGKVRFVAVVLIFIGCYTIASSIWDLFWRIVPDWISSELYFIEYNVPRIVISLILIAFGIYLIRGKKVKLDQEPGILYDAPEGAMNGSADAFYDRDSMPQTDETVQAKPEVIILGSTSDEKKEG